MAMGFDIARLNGMLLEALNDALDLGQTLERVCAGTGMAVAMLDLDGSEVVRRPQEGRQLDPLLARLRSWTGGEGGAQLLRGRVLSFLPGEAGDGAALCRLVPAGGEPRNILALALPLGMELSSGEEALQLLSKVYSYFGHYHSPEPRSRSGSYLGSGLARELILGDGDPSKGIYGDLIAPGAGGRPGEVEPSYIFAAIEADDPAELLTAERSIVRVLPKNHRLITGGRLLLLFCGVRTGQEESIHSKLSYFTQGLSLRCGLSQSFPSLEGRSSFRKQALLALELSRRPGHSRLCVASRNYTELMLAGALQQAGSRVLELGEIRTLAAHDELEHTDYLATLDSYLSHGRRVSAAAASMFIDRSTMKYRLQKIEGLLGEDLSQEESAHRLSIALCVWRLAHCLGESADSL